MHRRTSQICSRCQNNVPCYRRLTLNVTTKLKNEWYHHKLLNILHLIILLFNRCIVFNRIKCPCKDDTFLRRRLSVRKKMAIDDMANTEGMILESLTQCYRKTALGFADEILKKLGMLLWIKCENIFSTEKYIYLFFFFTWSRNPNRDS